MKVFFLYCMVGLTTVVGQTTILRIPLFSNLFYDLIIPLVVFLGLRLRDGRGVSLVIILGLVMDLLSGGIFGLYLTTYFWIFLSVKSVSRYFDVDDPLFQGILIALCVLGQHLVFCALLAPPWKGAQLLAAQMPSVLLQTILAVFTGGGVLTFLARLQTRFGTSSSAAQKEAADFLNR
jgi:cell shape-determining protein MreD